LYFASNAAWLIPNRFKPWMIPRIPGMHVQKNRR
jgi:hypothetical protein